jgi:TolA-binding protein
MRRPRWLPLAAAALLCAASSPRARDDAPSRDGWSALNMEAQAVMGELKLQQGDLRGARDTYTRSLELGAKVRGPKDEVAAQGHYRSAELALGDGEYGEARRHLELLVQRYPSTDWAERARRLLSALPGEAPAAKAAPDAPFVPALPSASPEEALARLRGALDGGAHEAALAEAHDFLRRHPARAEAPEVELAAAGLHLRRGEAARAVRLLKPLLASSDRALRAKAVHLLGAALTAVGLDEAVLQLVPAADPASASDRWTALSQAWRAGALERLGRRDEAAELYRAVAASGHDSPLRAYALGAIAADWDRAGKTARALDSLARADAEAVKWGLHALAESLELSRAALLERSRRLEEAQAAYGDFAARRRESPLAAKALYHRGLCLKRLGREAAALDCFRELAETHPGSAYAADAHLQLGQLYTALDRPDEAMTHYRRMAKSSEAKDADREALLLMAQVHYNAKRWDKAAPLYRRWLEGAPDDAKTAEVAGLLLVSVWHADRTSPELPALAAKAPRHPLVAQIRWDLAAAAYKAGDWAGAERLFREQIEAAPRDARTGDARFHRAEALRQLGRAGEAAEAYQRFLDAHPAHARRSEAAMRLGEILYAANDAASTSA